MPGAVKAGCHVVSPTVGTLQLVGLTVFAAVFLSTFLALCLICAGGRNVREALALVALQDALLGGVIGNLKASTADQYTARQQAPFFLFRVALEFHFPGSSSFLFSRDNPLAWALKLIAYVFVINCGIYSQNDDKVIVSASQVFCLA